MGHLIFIMLHILTVFSGFVGLIITIPLHLIYAVVLDSNKPEHARGIFTKNKVCPHCKEIVLKGALICKHCGKDLTEEPEEDLEEEFKMLREQILKERVNVEKKEELFLCPFCNEAINKDTVVCRYCSKQIYT